jgi:putrescine aminotransferase
LATATERTTAQWQALDSAHYLHPFTDYGDLSRKGSRIITRAEGIYLWDSDGHRILDGMAGLWCVNVGYGREELVEAARRQMRELPYYNSFFQCTHPPAIELSEVLTQLSPASFNHVFFTGSGSESNDTVLRLARYYWQLRGQPQKRVFISRHNAYHGSTVAAASLGGMKPMHGQGGLPIPGIEHIEQPYYFGYQGDLGKTEFGVECALALERKILEVGVDRVAAFIAEPIQGAGGVIIPPDTYWPEVQRICDQYDILLVADEVICGFGRLGHWFGSEHYAIRPDLMPIAKGMTSGYLPMGGVLVGDRVADVVINDGKEFFHGFTYSGHPACCAVALANIELIKRDALVERVREKSGPYLARQWATLADHPLVGETRSCGLVGALELVRDKATRARFEPAGRIGTLCRDTAVNNGLVMRAVGDTMIISPPLIIDTSQIDELVALARRSLDITAEHVL